MAIRPVVRPFVLGLGLASMLMAAGGPLFAQDTAADKPAREETREKRWEKNAEKTFRLGPGMARQLMTEEEWREHRKKMRSLNAKEREEYRKETHQKMVERAREKGIKLPEGPGMGMKRGDGMGGMGGGMGKGGDMGGMGGKGHERGKQGMD